MSLWSVWSSVCCIEINHYSRITGLVAGWLARGDDWSSLGKCVLFWCEPAGMKIEIHDNPIKRRTDVRNHRVKRSAAYALAFCPAYLQCRLSIIFSFFIQVSPNFLLLRCLLSILFFYFCHSGDLRTSNNKQVRRSVWWYELAGRHRFLLLNSRTGGLGGSLLGGDLI